MLSHAHTESLHAQTAKSFIIPCLMPCTTYYCCHCTAARQIANAITEEANCSVMFLDWKKQTCIQRLNTHRHTHVYIHAVKSTPESWDDWHHHTPNPPLPYPTPHPHLKHSHMHSHTHTALMGYLPVIRQCLAGFLWWTIRGWGRRFSAGGQTTGHMHTILMVMQLSEASSGAVMTWKHE